MMKSNLQCGNQNYAYNQGCDDKIDFVENSHFVIEYFKE